VGEGKYPPFLLRKKDSFFFIFPYDFLMNFEDFEMKKKESFFLKRKGGYLPSTTRLNALP
jgi:hypothetical protein